jgi:phosphomannomutase
MSDIAKLFKAYDMRGTVPFLTKEIYYHIGKGFVEKILKPQELELKVAVMRDARYSSPEFYGAFCSGVKDAGAEVLSLGMGTTDMMYAACMLYNCSGAEITASHNPKDDNGVKIVKKIPEVLGLATGLDIVRDYVVEKMKIPMDCKDDFAVDQADRQALLDFYFEKTREIGKIDLVDKILLENGKKLKVVVDTGNGIAGIIMDDIAKMYQNIELIPLFWEPDGNYPNHPADPQNVANLVDLKNKILETGSDMGCAYDGDGDRVYFLDEKGELINGDYLCALFAKYLLLDQKNGAFSELTNTIVALQPGSKCVADTAYTYDAVIVPAKQGHINIKNAMAKHNALYGGEFSGHHYFGSFGFMDSGVLAMALFFKIVAEADAKVSSLVGDLTTRYYITELMNPRIPSGQDFDLWNTQLRTEFAKKEIYGDVVCSDLDGLTVFFGSWRFNMRPSNTEPVVRFILETYNEDKREEKVELVKKIVGLS